MQSSDQDIPYARGLYALILGTALFLRLYHLGAAPLSDFEARIALQARALLSGAPSLIGTQPLAVTGTAALFFLLGDTNFTARLLFALSGSLLVFLPYLWRRTLGERTALLLAAGLAFAPAPVALSRLGGGPMPALALGAALLTAWNRGAVLAAGIFFGLFLLSGPWGLTGALGFGLALGAARWGGLPLEGLLVPPKAPPLSKGVRSWGGFSWGAGGAFLLGATLFLRFPQGIGAFGETLSAWGAAFFHPAGVPFLRVLAAWAFYHLLALVMGLVGAFLAWKEDLAWGRFALLWTLSALLAALLLPGRTVFDAAWALPPLYLLAALGLGRALRLPVREKVSAGLYALLPVVLTALMWLTLAGIPPGDPPLTETWSRWALVAGALLIALVGGVLTLGWERNAGLWGGAVGATLALGLVMLSQTWGMAVARPNNPAELWYPSPAPVRTDLLLDTLGDAAEWHAGRRDALSIRLDVESPALEWALRRFDLVLPGGADVTAKTMPLAVIAPADAPPPAEEVLYRGQRFLWAQDVGWEGALPPAAVRWFIFREAPLRSEYLLIWLRGDLFPGGSVFPPGSGP